MALLSGPGDRPTHRSRSNLSHFHRERQTPLLNSPHPEAGNLIALLFTPPRCPKKADGHGLLSHKKRHEIQIQYERILVPWKLGIAICLYFCLDKLLCHQEGAVYRGSREGVAQVKEQSYSGFKNSVLSRVRATAKLQKVPK